MAKEINKTCETFSISFDGQGANNHIHILAVIIHWITQDFKRRSMVVEFAEMLRGKSGKAMADIFQETIGPNFKRETKTVQDDIIKTITKERVSLKCAEKLFAVYGDNALNNNTFCDHLLKHLHHNYDDSPTSTTGLPKCRFHGHMSRIWYIAHIIALVVNAVLNELKAKTYAKAAELVAITNNQGGTFDKATCLLLSVY